MKLLILILSFMIVACTQTAQEEEVKIKTDIKKLKELISLPSVPIKAKWSINKRGNKTTHTSIIPGPTDWEVIAILTFPEETIKELINEKKVIGEGDKYFPIRSWYPKNFSKQLKKVNDTFYRTESKFYSAELFYDASFTSGFILPIKGTNDVYLYLS
jgi:Fe2+ transport system protein B